jgi:hypothetical protein
MAKLKHTIDDVVEVIGPLRDFYTKAEDGKFHLSIDGESSKLSEFRDKNIALMKELDELRPLKVKYEGIDPDATAKLTEAEAKLATFDGVDPAEYRLLKARPDATKRAAELETDLATEKAAHAATKFKTTTTVEFLKTGGRESAVDFIATEAAKVFAADGTTKELSTINPGVPLTVAEWMKQQVAVSDFAFNPSRGGGAGPVQGGGVHRLGAHTRQNELRDPTPQQLGAHASDIANGKLKVVYTT